MTAGHRVRRRREDEREPDANSTQASPGPALHALLTLQQSAGNQAVSRVLARDIQIKPVDYNPASSSYIPSDIVASKLKSQLKQSAAFMGALNQSEKQTVDRLTTANVNLRATDVPTKPGMSVPTTMRLSASLVVSMSALHRPADEPAAHPAP